MHYVRISPHTTTANRHLLLLSSPPCLQHRGGCNVNIGPLFSLSTLLLTLYPASRLFARIGWRTHHLARPFFRCSCACPKFHPALRLPPPHRRCARPPAFYLYLARRAAVKSSFFCAFALFVVCSVHRPILNLSSPKPRHLTSTKLYHICIDTHLPPAPPTTRADPT